MAEYIEGQLYETYSLANPLAGMLNPEDPFPQVYVAGRMDWKATIDNLREEPPIKNPMVLSNLLGYIEKSLHPTVCERLTLISDRGDTIYLNVENTVPLRPIHPSWEYIPESLRGAVFEFFMTERIIMERQL